MKRFFMRFNLQNGVGHFPATATVGAALQNADASEIQGYLDEFDAIQSARTDRVCARVGNAVEPLAGKKVVFFGDSNTSDNLGYRETVCRVASLTGVDASISGGTSATAIQFAHDKIRTERPDLVSVMLGANDSVAIGSEGFGQVSLAEYERNLRAILIWAKKANAKVLLMEITPIQKERFDHYFLPQAKLQSKENIALYNAIVTSLANELDVPLLRHDFPDLDAALDRDGIHLSCEGHEILAERWLTHAAKLF